MGEEVIGHGTWYDKMAAKIVARERRLGRSLDLIRTEMGIAASGLPHVGNLSDAARSFAVTLALREQGYKSELVAFADDKDGLRKVPVGMPETLVQHLGRSVTDIPDIFGCHESYGEHMTLLLREAMDECGIDYQFLSATEVYRSGMFNNEIRVVLANAKKIGEIMKEEVGQEKFLEALPYFAVCEKCGRIYTTKTYDFLEKEDRVLYSCEGMEVKGKWLEGCGYKGERGIKEGEGKLAWKGEFAVRWKALDIRFEAFGKEVADSVRVNDRICREILDWEPPSHAKYELFLDKSGKRMSKSAGIVFTPQTWFRYGSPQSLMLLLLKRFVGTRALDVTDVPFYMNELGELADIYFNRKSVKNEKERLRLKGLYEYCWATKPPAKPDIHVPYNLMAYIVKMAPKGNEEQYITETLRRYGYLQKNQPLNDGLRKRIEYASNWIKDFEEIKETAVNLTAEERDAITEIIEVLRTENDADKIQNTIFSVAKKRGLQPGDFFRTLYLILVGAPQGPRLGPYILAMGSENVRKALQRTIDQGSAFSPAR